MRWPPSAARLRRRGRGDGPTGVERCERLHPDLVVLDLMLLGLDGIEVCKRLRMTARYRSSCWRRHRIRPARGLAISADDY
jgi:two-component system alkaline phosphatase synthesis response regulator PhoP